MKYFLHDSNAFYDEKITRLYIKFGYEALGLFYTCLEKFAQQEKPINTLVLKHQLNIGKRLEKIWLFMEQIGLLSSNNGETFNKQLLNFSESYKIKKEKNAKRISEWREKQDNIENVTCNESISNAPKVKLSKVNRSKENKIIDISVIDSIYSLYPAKCSIRNASNGKCEKNKEQIKKLLTTHSEAELKKIIENYVKNCTATKTYMKNFTTFLNNLPVDLLNSIPETDKPQQKEKVFISGVEVVGYKEDGKPIYRHPG